MTINGTVLLFSNCTQSLQAVQSNFSQTAKQHSLAYEFCICMASYFILLVFAGILFNSWLIYTIYRSHELHRTSHYLVINLAVCDLLTSYNLIFDSVFLLRHQVYDSGDFFCGMNHTIYLSLLPLSIISVLLLTFEKLLTFICPFSHEKYLNKTTTAVFVLMVWLYSMLVGAFPLILNPQAVVIQDGDCYLLINDAYKIYQVSVNFSLPLVCIGVMNVGIYAIAMQSAARQRKLSNGTHAKAQQKRRWKAAKTIFLVVGNEMLCWFIYIIAIAVYIACGGCLPEEVPWIMNAINYTSVVTNPLIYGLLNISVRRSACRVCGMMKCWSVCGKSAAICGVNTGTVDGEAGDETVVMFSNV